MDFDPWPFGYGSKFDYPNMDHTNVRQLVAIYPGLVPFWGSPIFATHTHGKPCFHHPEKTGLRPGPSWFFLSDGVPRAKKPPMLSVLENGIWVWLSK